MSQIDELESRITAAMARISVGLGALSMRAAEPAGALAEAQVEADAAVTAALEEEKLVAAQLEERLRRIKERHAEEIAALQAQLSEQGGARDDALRAELDELKRQLAETVAAETLQAEVERLKARLADSSEADTLRAENEALRAELARQAETAARLDMDLQRLRQSNEQLREANGALREANEAGVGEPSLINRAMLAELEGLRATRAADAAEAGAILARLEPLLSTARNLPEGEDE